MMGDMQNNEEILKSFENDVASASMTQTAEKQLSAINVPDIVGVESLEQPGTKEGEMKIVRGTSSNEIIGYCWSTERGEWYKFITAVAHGGSFEAMQDQQYNYKYWADFLRKAKISSDCVDSYATRLSDSGMTLGMLTSFKEFGCDLEKFGISIQGHVIRIIRYAKMVTQASEGPSKTTASRNVTDSQIEHHDLTQGDSDLQSILSSIQGSQKELQTELRNFLKTVRKVKTCYIGGEGVRL
ncbi:uncharacterized protein LOC135847785 isoform X2 [Planococcus citri]|uniref:uncharacterized protein LOC135847785 isoform X2 n=1 Tax=Planococcus citri TaxID=170843 RepID=UPI0031F84CEB